MKSSIPLTKRVSWRNRLVSWLVGWLVGWLLDCLVGWLVGWSVLGSSTAFRTVVTQLLHGHSNSMLIELDSTMPAI